MPKQSKISILWEKKDIVFFNCEKHCIEFLCISLTITLDTRDFQKKSLKFSKITYFVGWFIYLSPGQTSWIRITQYLLTLHPLTSVIPITTLLGRYCSYFHLNVWELCE